MATQARSADKAWWPFRPALFRGEYDGPCRRFGCPNLGARWFNTASGHFYCESCAQAANQVQKQLGQKPLCELHRSR